MQKHLSASPEEQQVVCQRKRNLPVFLLGPCFAGVGEKASEGHGFDSALSLRQTNVYDRINDQL